MERNKRHSSYDGESGMKRSRSAMNMSAAQRRRNREIKAKVIEKTAPQCIADLEARGPLKVKNQVIGMLRSHGTGGIVLPDPTFRDTDFGAVVIDKNHLNGAPFDMAVVCEILNPEAGKGELRGTIKEVLGDIGNNDVRMLSVLRQFGLSQTFPDKVLKEVEELKDLFGDEFLDFDLVFCSSNGRPIESQIINRAFNKLIRDNGFPKWSCRPADRSGTPPDAPGRCPGR